MYILAVFFSRIKYQRYLEVWIFQIEGVFYCFGLIWVSPYHIATSNISNWSARVIFSDTCFFIHVSRLNPVDGVHPVIVQTVGRQVAQVKLTCVELKVRPWAWRARLPGAGVKPRARLQAGGGHLKQEFSLGWSEAQDTGFWLVETDTSPLLCGDSHVSLMLYRNIGGAVRFTHCSSTVQWPAVCWDVCLDATATSSGFLSYS